MATDAANTAAACAGCGAKLQHDDPQQPGYAPKEAMDRETVICRRCFRIKHYNEISEITAQEDDFLRVLNRIGTAPGFIVHIVDLFDLDGSLIGSLHRFAGGNPIVLAANKIDLFPKNVNRNRILSRVQKRVKEAGLKPLGIVLCSAKRSEGFDRLIGLLKNRPAGTDIFVVGATNVGKSTLINRLIRDFSDLDAELTVSRYPGTTLDMVHIPLEDGRAIIDTPGIVYKSRLTEIVDKADLAAILPEKPIRPLVYQLNERQTLFFGALVRFDFVKGERQSFTCYVSGGLKVHRTKLERASEVYEEHKGGLLSPPAGDRLGKLPPWTRHAIRIPPGGPKDVFVSGLGWIKANGLTGCDLVVHAPKGVKVIVRDPLI